MPRREITALSSCGLALGLVAVLIRFAFADHPDYIGHFAAGAGATMLLIVVVRAVVTEAGTPLTILLLVVSVAMGALAEATIFRLAAFDRMDFALQSAGAALAATLFTTSGSSERSVGAFFLGVGFLVLGFVIVAGATGAA